MTFGESTRKPYSDSILLGGTHQKLQRNVPQMVKGRTGKLYFSNLSEQFAAKSDVFGCVCALWPDPEDKERFFFFFGYYGEHWRQSAHAKIDEPMWQREQIDGWLSYMLWKKCVDKFAALGCEIETAEKKEDPQRDESKEEELKESAEPQSEEPKEEDDSGMGVIVDEHNED